MKIKTQNSKSVELLDSAFSVPYNESLVHQVITAILSGARSGTKAQKNRSQVSGGLESADVSLDVSSAGLVSVCRFIVIT